MKRHLLIITFAILSCNQNQKIVQQYSIEALFSNTRSTGGSFSSNGDKLIFSSDKSGIFNVYEMNLTSKEEKQITNSTEDSYFSIGYTPQTNEALYSSDQGGNENSHIYLIRENKSIDLTPGEKTKASFMGWTFDENEMYFQSNKRDPRYFDLYKMNVKTLESKLIYENNQAYSISDISQNDKYLILIKQTTREVNEMFLFNIENKTYEKISDNKSNHSSSGFDKDNLKVFYTTDYDNEFSYLMSYEIESKQHELIYKTDWDVRYGSLTYNDTYRIISINEDASNKILVQKVEDNSIIDIPIKGQTNINSVRFSKDEKKIRLSIGNSNSPSNIFVYSIETEELIQVSNNLNEKINQDDLVQGKVIRYKSIDSIEIPAILYKPHNANEKNKTPALVWVHGGPGGQSTLNYNALVQYLVNNGYTILAINNRGSSGYGKTFYSLDDKNHGGNDLQDCVWAKKWLKEQDYIEQNSIGIIGGSYGGFMTMAAMAFEPDVFKVGVNLFGVTNWIRTLKSIPPYWESARKQLYDELGDPYSKDSIHLYNISPLFHAQKIKNPVIVLQGKNDPRVLQVESDEIVAKVKENKIPVEYVVFEDEGHGFVKKKNQIKGYEKILEFLNNYLK